MSGAVLDSERLTRVLGCQMATSKSVKLHKLRKFVTSLSTKEGRGKEFVSLYIPPNASTDRVVAALKEASDSAEVENASSRDVRNRLQDAIKNIIQRLRARILCGNIRCERFRNRSVECGRTYPSRADRNLPLRCR
jgi:hypothetical protein